MTQRLHTKLTVAALVMAIIIPIVVNVLSRGTISLIELPAKKVKCIEDRLDEHDRKIQTIQDTMLTEEKLEQLLKSNNALLINELFEKGYIRAKK